MQSEAAPKGGVREGLSQWGTAETSDQQQPEDSGLVQSLRFYVARANAENRCMSDSPVASELFRYSPESRTATAAAMAADKEDRLLHLVRGYGCAVILANLITTFIFSMALMFVLGTNSSLTTDTFPASFALTSNIEIVPAVPVTKLEEALAHPRSVIITAFDSGGFSVMYRHDVVGWEASRARSSATLFLSANRKLVVTSTTVIFEDALTGLSLAEWELWDKDLDSIPHKVLGDALHASADGRGTAASPPGTRDSERQTSTRTQQTSEPNGVLSSRRLSENLAQPMATSSSHRFSAANQIPAALHGFPTVQTNHERDYDRTYGAFPYITW